MFFLDPRGCFYTGLPPLSLAGFKLIRPLFCLDPYEIRTSFLVTRTLSYLNRLGLVDVTQTSGYTKIIDMLRKIIEV